MLAASEALQPRCKAKARGPSPEFLGKGASFKACVKRLNVMGQGTYAFLRIVLVFRDACLSQDVTFLILVRSLVIAADLGATV